ncbi:MAG: PorV/PorQ family protein [Candidatus Goldbacteria bacterium]|nr:PorV/PorQ family protein [Candidatus Goldiibacteriota bacterium]
MKKIILLTAFILVAVISSANNLPYSQDINVKNAGAAGALSVFINDSLASFINPALLGWTNRQNLLLTYYNLYEGGMLSNVSYALPMIEKGTVSISILYLKSGEIIERDLNNQETGNKFFDSTTHINLSYGINLFYIFNVGFNIKYINRNFYNNQYNGVGADCGTSFELPYNIKLSTSLENIIKPQFKYSDTSYDTLPLKFNIATGFSTAFIDSINGIVKLGLGLTIEEDNKKIGWQTGAEYEILKIFAVRGGLNDAGFSIGASVMYFDFIFDYAFIEKPLDFIHRFSLAYLFGDNVREIENKIKTQEEKIKYELVQKVRQDALNEFKEELKFALDIHDYETAKEVITKALVWAPYDNWFLEKEKEVNELYNKDKKQQFLQNAEKLIKDGSYIDALVLLKNAQELDPNNTEIQNKIKRTKEYVRTLGEKNIEVESANKEQIKNYFDKGLDYYSLGKYEQAVAEWNKIIQLSPLQNQVYSYIKKAEEKIRKKEDQEKATKILQKQRIMELYNEAVIAHTKGKFEESIKLWKEILKLDPNNKEANEYLNKVVEEYKKIQQQKLQW